MRYIKRSEAIDILANFLDYNLNAFEIAPAKKYVEHADAILEFLEANNLMLPPHLPYGTYEIDERGWALEDGHNE
jgi:hypothetical protein